MRRWQGPALVAALLGATAAPDTGTAQDGLPEIHGEVRLKPGIARLGERVVYRGRVVTYGSRTVRWSSPEPIPGLTWGTPRSGYQWARPSRERVGRAARGPGGPGLGLDTAWVEIPLQAFELGVVPVPGLAFQMVRDPRRGPVTLRLPSTRLLVVPVMTPADSQASLRPLRGPLAAPWWERVPWRQVLLALGLVAAAVGLLLWIRRRRVKATPARALARDPAAEALAALAELRALGLPGRGRFAEHAFRLGQILRRYLEATVVTTRPGDTTPELVAHLGEAELDADELRRVAGLLRVWDRIKFARDPFTVEEAGRAEDVVEGFVGRARADHGRQVA